MYIHPRSNSSFDYYNSVGYLVHYIYRLYYFLHTNPNPFIIYFYSM